MLALCHGARERIQMLRWLLRYAFDRFAGQSPSAVATLRIQGWQFTLDWARAEHVPLREVLLRSEYWQVSGFRPRPGDLVIDVGANAGVFAVVAGTLIGSLGRLVAIEPNPDVVGRLRTNLDVNGLAGRSSVIECALAKRAGHRRLSVGVNSTIGTLVDADAVGIDVEVETLDALSHRLDLGDIDLVKIDVEGSECAVLDGGRATLARTRRLVVEVSDQHDIQTVTASCRSVGLERIVSRVAGPDSRAIIVFACRN